MSKKIISKSFKNEIAICNIGAINLHKDYTDEEYYKKCYTMLMTARAVILGTEYTLPRVGYTTKNRMSVGIGVTNLAYCMARNKKYYTSKEGKVFLHFIAERHSYFLHKAALDIAIKYGNAPWIHKTKYPQGWLPIDTYNKNVDGIANFELRYDWETLRAGIIAQGGIAFSVLESFMPCEASSKATNSTNGLYPIRRPTLLKTDNSYKNIFIAPEYERLQNYYEFGFDIPYYDMIDCYAIFQKFCGQAISADTYYDMRGDNKTRSLRESIEELAYFFKMGIKTSYYTVMDTDSEEDPDTSASGCESGACTL